MLPSQFLDTRSNAFPDKEALACQAQGVPAGIIESDPNPLRNSLVHEDSRQQDRVAVCQGDSVQSAVSVSGAFRNLIVSQHRESCGNLLKTSASESNDVA